MIESLSLENFKAFGTKQTLDIRPITLLYGKNSSGKSSCLRALQLFAQSVRTKGTHRDLLLSGANAEFDFGSYSEMVYKHESERTIELLFNVRTLNSPDKVEYKVQLGVSKSNSYPKVVQEEAAYVPAHADRKKFTFASWSEDQQTKENEWVTKSDSIESRDSLRIPRRNEKQHYLFHLSNKSLSHELTLRLIQNLADYASNWAVFKDRRKKFVVAPTGTGEELKKARLRHGTTGDALPNPTKDFKRICNHISASPSLLQKIETVLENEVKSWRLERITGRGFRAFYVINELTEELKKELTSMDLGLKSNNREFANRRDREAVIAHDILLHIVWTWTASYRDSIDLPSVLDSELRNLKNVYALRDAPKRILDQYEIPLLEGGDRDIKSQCKIVSKYLPGFGIERELVPDAVLSATNKRQLGYELRLKDPHNKDEIGDSWVDVGFGISQIVPLLFTCARSEGLTCVEQPELHLHPSAQTNLADFFAEIIGHDVTTKKESSPQVGRQLVIETHSEHLILRIKQLMSEGKLCPEDVSLNVIEKEESGSKIRRIHMDTRGRFLDAWPGGFFEERGDLL